MITGYISVKSIFAKIYRDLNINIDINEAHVYEWVAEVLEKIGTYYQYKESKTCLELKDGKAILPLNFHRLKDIMFNNRALSWASNTVYNNYSCEGCVIPKCCTGHTFYISDNHIITDIPSTEVNEKGNNSICIIYLSVPVDEEGYPLVPDDVYFTEACVKYVTYMLDYREWRKGNIPDKVLQKSEKEYLFYIGAAKGSANMPGLHQLEGIRKVWVRMLPLNNEYNTFFSNNSNSEQKYIK